MKKSLLILCLFAGYASIAQNTSVDLATGTLTLGLPLFSVYDGDVALQGVMSYSASGVRVTDGDGWVGHNWSFSVDAAVSRSFRGLPDDYLGAGTNLRKGWLHGDMGTRIKNFTFTNDNNPATCSDETANWTFLSGLGYYEDTEPDVFNVNAPGISFRFYFDENAQPRVVPYQDVLITKTTDPTTGRINSFTITDANGTQYIFDAIEKVAEDLQAANAYYLVKRSKFYEASVSYAISWKLTKIISATYGTIDLTYKEIVKAIDDRHYSKRFQYPVSVTSSFGSGGEVLKYSRSSVSQVLEKISTPTAEVEFISKIMVDSIPDLDSIRVYEKRSGSLQLVREFNFEYRDIIYESEDGMTIAARRKFLESIQEKAGALTLPPYMFYYHGTDADNYVQMPVHSSELKDEWEFYKDTALPYEETLQTGTLRKVVYPYGGYTAFFFEPHSYWDASTSSSVQEGGIRVRKTITHDGLSTASDIIKEYEYTMSNGQTSGKLIFKPFFAINTVRVDKVSGTATTGLRYRQIQTFGGSTFSTPYTKYFILKSSEDLSSLETFNGSAVGYERVVEKQKDAGKTVYEFDMPAAFNDVSANSNEWLASTVAIARTSTGTSACFESIGIPEGLNVYPYAVNPNYNFARGLLKKSTEYREDEAKVREVVYEYQRVFGATAIRPVYGLVLEELPTYYYNGTAYVDSRMFLYSKYPVFTEVATVIKKETETIFHSADLLKKTESITDYFYESTVHRNLTKVTRTNSDQVQSVVRYKYLKDFTLATPADSATLALSKLSLAHRVNTLVETLSTKISGGVEKCTDASLTIFQDVGGKIFPYKRFSFQSADGSTSLTPSSIQTTTGNSTFQYDLDDYVLTNTILTVDTFGNPVETIGRDKHPATAVQGYGGTLPVLNLSNTRLQEVAYSDFETTTSVDFASWPGPTFSAGRTGVKAINIGVGGTFKLTRTITKNQSVNFIFSCWVKAATAGNLTIKAKNGSADLITPVSLPFVVSAAWKYYHVSIPASSLPASFTAEITSSVATILDDVAFYPDHADFIAYTYTLPYGKASETDTRGTSLFYEYDEWGRIRAVYDRQYNVVKKYDYHTRP